MNLILLKLNLWKPFLFGLSLTKKTLIQSAMELYRLEQDAKYILKNIDEQPYVKPEKDPEWFLFSPLAWLLKDFEHYFREWKISKNLGIMERPENEKRSRKRKRVKRNSQWPFENICHSEYD